LFIKIKQRVENVSFGEDNIVTLDPGSIIFIQFKYIKDLFERGAVA
jgi:hypothetical protein